MNDRVAHERFEAVYALVREPLVRYLARRCAVEAVDDLFIEVLTVLWRRIQTVPVGGEVPWTLAVARRTLANHRRAHGRAARLLTKLALLEPGIDPGPEPKGADLDLERALGVLKADDREILRLFAWEQLATAEIAVVLGITPNAAGVRLHRAKERLRVVLQAQSGKNDRHGGQEEVVERKEAQDGR